MRRIENKKYTERDILKALTETTLQLNRAYEIILRMKNFCYKGEIKKTPIDIDLLINESIDLIRSEYNQFPVMIEYKKYTSTKSLHIDKIHIQQVILNLSRNALDAMRDHDIDSPKLVFEIELFDPNMIEIKIIDNGPGYSKDIAHKIFEPNFTTKPYGIGLGLTVSRKIVECHGGKLYADLNPTYGSCFKFTLPIVEQ